MPPTTSATLGRFAWHELLTTDPAAAQAFYTEVVGWTIAKSTGGGAHHEREYVMWMAGNTPVGGVLALPADAVAMGTRPSWLAYIEVPDVEATTEQAVAAGATVLAPLQTVDQVGRFVVLRDPQGAVFAIITNATPLPEERDPKPLEFSWHELVADDERALLPFYEKLFGWERKGEFELGDNKGAYRMFGRDRFTYGGAMDKPAGMNMPSHWVPYVTVQDSADAAVERAKKAGGELMVGPMATPDGGRIAVLTDPQGAMFAVHSNTPS